MPAEAEIINLNDSTPAPPSGGENVKWQKGALSGTDPATGYPIFPGSCYVVLPPILGGASVKTASYLATAADAGTLLVFNSASALTLTLPAASPSPKWILGAQNIGAGALTITPNGLQLDGLTASISLTQAQGVLILTDATNYFSERGMGAGGGGGAVAEVNETPAGTLNSINKVFTLTFTPSPASSVQLALNGVEQYLAADYTISATTITYTVAPKAGDLMAAWYTH